MRCIFVSILLVSIVFAGTVTQTDWSGGGGVQGPVFNWNDVFWSSDASIDFSMGKLALLIEHPVDGDFEGARSVYSTDIDGDGDADVLGAASIDDEITWWENSDTSPGVIWTEHIVDGNFYAATSVYATDIDGDGDADILGAAVGDDDITWWENTDGTGTVWTEHTVDGNFEGAYSVYSTDIDGDGDADILGAAQDANDITWWENTDGTGVNWTEHIVDGDFVRARSVYSTDIDGDGDADVLGAADYDTNDITWWENTDGTGTNWTEHTIDGDFNGAISVYSTDIDGDGDADVLGAARIADDITWWENIDGTGTTWTEHTVDGDFDRAYSVYASDVDGDGDTDVLGAAFFANDITWWENTDGIGTNWTEHTVDGNFLEASSVYATDIDGDGDADILGAAHTQDDITWWDVLGFSPTGVIESSILDAGDIGEWIIFLAISQAPIGSSISYQFRSSDDSSNMGAWSDTVFSPDTPLEGILADSTRYLQYKVILETYKRSVSPELYEVAFSYTLLTGIEENESGEVLSWSLSALQNPSYGIFSASVSVPETGIVELSIYDVAGRVVAEASQEFIPGTHSVNFSGLSEGVYYCTMCAGEFSATKRIVVLD